ncbi:hypothetical protein [Hornefia butyriciproducens]|uniref:hypothetical protein n=1 Tax=Hornefia butyriciproducens TaxID=2652293 RepID=UPI0023F2ECCE|nr:hypothetical protein [Hornefia butyriciproducens]MDD6299029.1 hypothetical protein [Hornefia butyriciproducens]
MGRNKRNKSRKTGIALLAAAMILSQIVMPGTELFAAEGDGAAGETTGVQTVREGEENSTASGTTEEQESAESGTTKEKAKKNGAPPADAAGPEKSEKNEAAGSAGEQGRSDRPLSEQKNEEKERRRIVIRATDRQGKPIEQAKILMERSLDARTWSVVSPDADSSGGQYTLDVKDKRENLFVTYRFSVMARGYTPHEGQKFTFQRKNQYFDPAEDADPVEITVRMFSADETLNAAKDKAIQELLHYKEKDGYRETEQEQLQQQIDAGIEKIREAASVGEIDYALKTAKERIDRIKTRTQYENEEARDRIYFRSEDGKTVVRPDKYGMVTLTTVDSGTFHIGRADGTDYANDDNETDWDCTWKYTDPDHGDIAWNVIIGAYGQYQGKFVGNYDASVTLRDTGQKINFKVRVTDGHIDRLRAVIDGEDASGAEIHVMGSEKKKAAIEGRLYGTDRWISIPAHALKYTPGGSTSMNHATAQFRTWGTSGSITYSLVSRPSVKVRVGIRATIVHPTGIEVTVPKEAYVDDWDGAFDRFVGIREGDRPGEYRVRVYPENASNPSVRWTDLTPDIAEFQEKHAGGIVPRKAGVAKFRVTCVDNPSVSKVVSIRFKYMKPLKTAVSDKSVYYARVGDSPLRLHIITNGEWNSVRGASEQRFHWTYSTGGVAAVKDSVRYDPSSVTIPRWVEHSITILGEGTVYVTGKPYDTTGGCKPVRFKVVVSDDIDRDREAAERVERMINAIGEVTLEKKGQIQGARAAYNALTRTQKGLVDEKVYAKLVAAELRLRQLERQQSGDSSENGGPGGGTQPGAPGGGDSGGGTVTPGGETTKPDPTAESGTKADARTPEASIKPAKATLRPAADRKSEKTGQNAASARIFREVEIRKTPKKTVNTVQKLSPMLSMILLLALTGTFGGGALRRYMLYRRERS